MGVFGKVRGAGLWLNSLRGVIWIVTAIPSLIILLGRWTRGLDWSETLTLFMVALASGVVLAFFGLKLIEALSYRLTGRSERKRIRQQIEGLKGRG